MTGVCIGQYSDGGVMHCAFTMPWWALALIIGVCAAVLIIFDKRKP